MLDILTSLYYNEHKCMIEVIIMTNAEFETFKDNMKHRVKRSQIDFIRDTLSTDIITDYYNNHNKLCALYTLDMLDYISKLNNISLCTDYNYLRNMRYEEPIYPLSIVALALAENVSNETILERFIEKDKSLTPIPEFARHNIIEGDVFNVQ